MCSSCGTKWLVIYPPDEQHPSGWTEVKPHVIAARTAAAQVPGATYRKKLKGE